MGDHAGATSHEPHYLRSGSTVYIAGHRGLVGSAIWRHLAATTSVHLVGASSTDLDLRDDRAVRAYLGEQRPEVIVLAAAKVGGILANATYPADFLVDNLRIQVNVLQAAQQLGVPRVLFLGSSCIYPKFAPQPIPESALLTGPLESTNDAYAIAKIAGILQVQATRRQHGLDWISAMPTNLYGPGDNFDPVGSHVLPALIRRFHEAVETGAPEVTLWGTGTARREFLHVDDLAAACALLIESYHDSSHINVGTGVDLTIAELAALVAEVTGFTGHIAWDPSKPDGTPRKVLDVARLAEYGFAPSIELRAGITSTYQWYLEHRAEARVALG